MHIKNKYRRRERIIYIVLGAVILSLASGFIYTTFYTVVYKKNSIRKDKLILQGASVIEIDVAPKSYALYIVDFVFDYKGKKYNIEIKNGYEFRKMSNIIGRSFPVACQRSNVNNAFILIKPEDFEYFEIPFPDSLNWVNKELLK